MKWLQRLISGEAVKEGTTKPTKLAEEAGGGGFVGFVAPTLAPVEILGGPEPATSPPPTVGPMEAQALALSADERGLLGYLLWAYPDTGALHFKELALASGWPYGAVIAGLTRLQAAGLVRRTQGCWEPVPALWREVRLG